MSERDNSGALFTNDRKQSDRHPDWTGKAMVDGVEYRVSAWKKTSRDGNDFISLAFSKPAERDTSF